MDEYLVDARGEVCPKPLILTKRALKECQVGQPIRILIDNETSKNNVMRFLSDNGIQAETTEKEGMFSVTLFGATAQLVHPEEAAYCSTSSTLPHIIVIKSNRMGRGDDALGELLMKAFVNTIKEVSPLPGTIVFYNSGIFLTTDDSPVVESLQELEQLGVKLLVCGTCTDFYGKQKEIHIGTISNMYTILEALTTAGKIIEP